MREQEAGENELMIRANCPLGRALQEKLRQHSACIASKWVYTVYLHA